MQINHGDFFEALGYAPKYYDPGTKQFEQEEIVDEINDIIQQWKKKYPKLNFDTRSLKFDKLVNFNHSFTTEITHLNFET